MDVTDPLHAFVAGQIMSAMIALVGMMASFNWAVFSERGDADGVRCYRNNTIIVILFLFAFPAMHVLFLWNEANRSLTHGAATVDRLEIWNAQSGLYEKVQP